MRNLVFNEPFEKMDFYPTNPSGRWRFNDFWQKPTQAGYVDFGAKRTFMINQTAPTAETLPFLPVSQLDPSVIRITCRRAKLNERPALKALVNQFAGEQNADLVDKVSWLGAYMTTEKLHPFAGADITRPAYVEFKFRFSPANITGVSSGLWLYDTSEATGEAEIDILEGNDIVPTFWKTNIHHAGAGPHFNIQHNSSWIDGLWHTVGLLWEAESLRIYRDGVLSGSVTGADAAFFSQSLRLVICHTCDPYYAQAGLNTVPANIDEVYLDLDHIRVWK
jgi:hypothetical protein